MSHNTALSPFEVLGLRPTATLREIEREGQRRLAMIAAGIADDCTEEAEHRVRWALDELRDPLRRLAHEALLPSLGPERFQATGPALAAEIDAALPRPEPTTMALAEEILWRRLEAPIPYALAAGHAVERERAFARRERRSIAPALAEELEWGELVAFRPRTKRPKPSKAKIQGG